MLAGSCALPITLQAVDIPVITDAECTAIWGNNYNGDVHVCVYDAVNQDRGACNVRYLAFKNKSYYFASLETLWRILKTLIRDIAT